MPTLPTAAATPPHPTLAPPPQPSPWKRPGWAWLALAGMLASGCLAAPALWPLEALSWQPQLALLQPWRWWTPAWAHLSPSHLGFNLLGLAALAVLGWRARLGPGAALAWALAWPLTHLGLLTAPGLAQFVGLSGVLHAGVAVVGLALLTPARPVRERRIGAGVLLGLALKLLGEEGWAEPLLRQHPGQGFAVAPLSHLCGALAGAASAAAVAGLAAWARWRQRSRAGLTQNPSP